MTAWDVLVGLLAMVGVALVVSTPFVVILCVLTDRRPRTQYDDMPFDQDRQPTIDRLDHLIAADRATRDARPR